MCEAIGPYTNWYKAIKWVGVQAKVQTVYSGQAKMLIILELQSLQTTFIHKRFPNFLPHHMLSWNNFYFYVLLCAVTENWVIICVFHWPCSFGVVNTLQQLLTWSEGTKSFVFFMNEWSADFCCIGDRPLTNVDVMHCWLSAGKSTWAYNSCPYMVSGCEMSSAYGCW